MSPPVGFGKKCPKIVGYKVCKFIYTWLNWLNLTPIQRYAVFRHQLRKDAVSLNFSLTFSLSNAFLVFKRNVFSLHLVPCNLPWNGGGGGREFLKKESFYARTLNVKRKVFYTGLLLLSAWSRWTCHWTTITRSHSVRLSSLWFEPHWTSNCGETWMQMTQSYGEWSREFGQKPHKKYWIVWYPNS